MLVQVEGCPALVEVPGKNGYGRTCAYALCFSGRCVSPGSGCDSDWLGGFIPSQRDISTLHPLHTMKGADALSTKGLRHDDGSGGSNLPQFRLLHLHRFRRR